MRGLLYTGQNATGALQGPQGPINGQSKRSTLGTYFDYNGVLRTAQPYQLRPNYVFDGSKWELDGFLKEGQATNHMTDSKDITTMFSSNTLSYITVHQSFKGSAATYYEITNPVTGTLWAGGTSWTGIYNSFYCRPPDGKSGNISYTYQAGTNNIAINIVNSKVTQTQQNNTCTLSSEQVGDGWFRILTVVPNGSNKVGNLVIFPTNNDAAATLGWCFALPQSEDNTFSSPIITTGTALTRAGD